MPSVLYFFKGEKNDTYYKKTCDEKDYDGLHHEACERTFRFVNDSKFHLYAGFIGFSIEHNPAKRNKIYKNTLLCKYKFINMFIQAHKRDIFSSEAYRAYLRS